MAQIITAATVDDAIARGEPFLAVPPGAVLTSAARDRAQERGLPISETTVNGNGSSSGNGAALTVRRWTPDAATVPAWSNPTRGPRSFAPEPTWKERQQTAGNGNGNGHGATGLVTKRWTPPASLQDTPAWSRHPADAPGARYTGPRPYPQLCDFDRVRDAMRRAGLAGIVCALPHNVHYLSGFDCDPMWEFAPYVYAIVPLDGEPALVTGSLNLARAVEYQLWITDIYPASLSDVVVFDTSAMLETELAIKELKEGLAPKASANAHEAIWRVLGERGLLDKPLGFDDLRLPPRLPGPLQVVDAVDVMREVRMIKTPAEIDRLRLAAEVNEAASLEAVRQVPRLPTWEAVVNEYKAGMARRSAQAHYLVGGVQHSMATFQTAKDYPLRRGDFFMVDALGTKDHYYGDFGRAGSWGPAPAEVRRRYDALRKGLWAGLEACRPGMLFREVNEIVRETIRREGNSNQRLAGLHSVGLEHTDQPRRPDMRVQANMVMNFDIGYMEAGFGAIHLEDTFLVTDSGYDLLTSGKNALIEV